MKVTFLHLLALWELINYVYKINLQGKGEFDTYFSTTLPFNICYSTLFNIIPLNDHRSFTYLRFHFHNSFYLLRISGPIKLKLYCLWKIWTISKVYLMRFLQRIMFTSTTLFLFRISNTEVISLHIKRLLHYVFPNIPFR